MSVANIDGTKISKKDNLLMKISFTLHSFPDTISIEHEIFFYLVKWDIQVIYFK